MRAFYEDKNYIFVISVKEKYENIFLNILNQLIIFSFSPE